MNNRNVNSRGPASQTGAPHTSWWMRSAWILALLAAVVAVHGHGDTMSSATSITLGGSVSGAIDFGGDEDWFVLQISSSGLLAAYTTGNTDTYGYLVNSSGTTLAYNDDDPYPNFRVSASVTAGTYYIRIRHFSSGGTGDYILTTSLSATTGTTATATTTSSSDAGNSIDSALAVSAGSGYGDAIDFGGDEDFFRLQLSSSGTLTAYTIGSTDTYGYLLDVNGSILAYNDDNPYPNFRVSASVSAGTYYVRVRHFSSSGTGSYTLYTEFSGSGSAAASGTDVSLSEALDQTGLSWSTSGHASWYGQTGVSYFGGDAASSGSISHSQSTHLQTTVTGPATVSFYWTVSSEYGYDVLYFAVDGIEQASISGELDWNAHSYNLSSGTHTLQWTYSTDGSILSGSNRGWVDRVVVSPPAAQISTVADTPDLLFRHPQYGLNGVWFMDNHQLLQSAFLLPDLVPDLDWSIVGAGDFNQDGNQDLVWQHDSAGFIGVWFMDGRAKTGAALTNPGQVGDLDWRIVGVADFNWDQHPDLLWQHQSTTEIAIWYMDGLNLLSSVYTSPSTPSDRGWQVAGTGDFNRDGRTDIIWQHADWDYVALWYMNGALFSSSAYTTPYSPYDLDWDIVDSGDFNQDGYPDFLWQHRAFGMLGVWYMNNASMTSSTATIPSSPDPWDWQVQAVGDFNFADAQLSDTDDDLMHDAWEQQHFSTLARNGAGDYDGDGLIDLQEFRSGTSPIVESGLRVFTPLE